MKKILLTVAAIATLAAPASAARITAISAGAGTGTGAGVIPGVVAKLVSASVVTGAENDGTNAALAVPTNRIDIALDVYQKNVPFSLTFDFDELGVPAPVNVTEYLMTITLVNALNANGTQPGSASDQINGFDIIPGATPLGFAVSLSSPPAATSDTFAVMTPNLAAGFRYGGLNGGGPALSAGGSSVSTIPLTIASLASGAGSFSITFTANPEPTTMLLGGLALVPGYVALRRRRRRNGAEEEKTEAPAV